MKTTQSRIKHVVKDNLDHRHGFGRVLRKQVEPMQSEYGCQIHGNPSAWWKSDLSVAFLRFHFADRHDRATKKILLLWDDFSAHFTESVLSCACELNILLVNVPPGYTWVCQPADVAWIRPLKSTLRELWLDSIRQQVLSSRASGVKFKLEPPKRSTIVAWISTAWDNLPSFVIVNGIKKCKLVYGEEEDHETMDGYVDDSLLSTLMESLDIEHVISSTDDIENAVDDEEDQDGELRVFYL
ncbi:hypothetical protein AeNC1_017361 [Aphanomyces euteiches]|nr:hypothetical protein AeNC1_017361 [Aphanomyces euteiches]